jgi:hypothetical protein
MGFRMSKSLGASSRDPVAIVQSVVHDEEGRQVTGLVKEGGEPAALGLAEQTGGEVGFDQRVEDDDAQTGGPRPISNAPATNSDPPEQAAHCAKVVGVKMVRKYFVGNL